MNALAPVSIATTVTSLPALVDRAVASLAKARTSAEVLEAREQASVIYDIAKRTARLAKAKQAHDELIAAAYRAQADALEIDAQAKRRLADEYDAAQERGDASAQGQHGAHVPDENMRATTSDLGLSRKEIHEARIVRDAEEIDPGIVRRTVNDALAAGEEPSKAKVRRAVLKVVQSGEPAPVESTPNTRFLNIAWDAEHRPSEFDFPAMTNFADLASAAERVVRSWADAAKQLRRLAQS